MALLPQSEVIEKALRAKRTVYPEIALREIVANALIHQDFPSLERVRWSKSSMTGSRFRIRAGSCRPSA